MKKNNNKKKRKKKEVSYCQKRCFFKKKVEKVTEKELGRNVEFQV